MGDTTLDIVLQLIDKLSAPLEQARKKLADTSTTVDNVRKNTEPASAALAKMSTAFKGDQLLQQANNVVAAIDAIGGASKLTEAEQARVNATLEKALDKYRALGQTAPAEMQALADATKATDSAWGQFVSKFDIKAAFTDPIGTAKSAATAFGAELGTIVGIGAAVVAGIVAVAGAAFALAKNAASAGAELDDMADKTGLTVPALSRMSNAAQVLHVDMGTLTDTVFKLEQRMGEGGDAFNKALAQIGLSTDQLKAAGPDRYLELVAAGLDRLDDPAARAAAGAALFGKAYKDVAATLKDLPAAFDLTKDITPWTAEQAADAEKFEMQLASLKVHAEALGLAIGRELIVPVSSFVGVVVDVTTWLGTLAGNLSGLTGMFHLAGDAFGYGAAMLRQFREEAEKIPPITGDAANGVKAWQQHVKEMGTLHVPTLTEALDTEREATKTLTESIRLHGEAQKKAEADAKRYAEAHARVVEKVRELEVIMPGLRHAVGELDTTELKSIETHLKNEAALEKAREAAKKLSDQLRALQRDDFASVTEGLEKVGQKSTELEQVKVHLDHVQAAADRNRAAFESLADLFVRLGQVSGGSFGTILGGLGQVLVLLDAANKEVAKYQKVRDARPGGTADGKVGNYGVATALFAGKDSKPMEKLASAAASAGAIVQGVKDVWSATESHATRAGNAVGGMMAGFKAGAAFGPWGMAIGAAAGLVVGLVRGKPAWAKVADDVGKDFGAHISKELADAIAKSAKSDFHGSTQAAEIGALASIIKEAGGLSEKNLPQMTARLHDVFSMIETHQMTIEQGTKVLDENWATFVAAATDGDGRISASLKEIIRLNTQFGTESKAIADFMKQQAQNALSAFNALAGYLDFSTVGDAVTTAQKAIDELTKAGRQGTDEWREAQKKLTDALTAQHEASEANKQELDDLGLIAVASFGAALAAGTPFFDALRQQHDGLQTLRKAYADLGLDVDNVALKGLLLEDTIVSANPKLTAAIDGLAGSLVALDNMGQLNADTFAAMERTGAKLFDKLLAESTKAGGGAREALLPMQKWLHQAVKEAELLGTPLDDATQAMVDQSKELGLWKDENKSAMDRVADAIEYIAKAFGYLPEAAEKASKGIGDAIDKLPKTISIPIDFPTSGPSPYPNPFPDGTSDGGAQATGGDYWVTKPTLFLAGEAGAERATFTPAGKASVERDAMITTVYISPTIYLQSDDAKDPDRVAAALDEAMTYDRGLIRTKIERVAVKALQESGR